jgi:ABC-2 type transport system ATP-binding protein
LQIPSTEPHATVEHEVREHAPAEPLAAIETTGLVKRYGATVALSGLSMTVSRGEVFGFLGPNGAGKTTAVKLLLGLAAPTSGSAQVLGAPVGDRGARHRIGYLPELFRYQGWLTAREILGFHCQLSGMPRSRRHAEVEAALRITGLAGRGDDRLGNYSKGMQQRLGLGVALLGRPELVILDEPTSALDPVGRHEVRAIIQGLRTSGATVFLNSHLLNEVEQLCDRVAVLDRGRVVALGTMRELLAAGAGVRLRVTGLDRLDHARLQHFGAVVADGGWLTFASVGVEAVPDVVAEVVGLGGRVYAVEPQSQTLEDRFLELLEES